MNTRDHTTDWNPIPRWKLAKEIGKKVKEYLEASTFSVGPGLIADECKRIQREGYQDSIDKVYLTRLVHVSRGSWQPELYYGDL